MLNLGAFAHHEWSAVPVTQHAGESGTARQQTLVAGPYRIRKVRYTAGYRADHWCERGHIALVLAGNVTAELRDMGAVTLPAGTVFWMGDGREAHRVSSEAGAELYIVDETRARAPSGRNWTANISAWAAASQPDRVPRPGKGSDHGNYGVCELL